MHGLAGSRKCFPTLEEALFGLSYHESIPRVPQLLLDPWSPGYEPPVQTEGPGRAASGDIDPRAETDEWRAVAAPAVVPDHRLYFIDGTRRIEARVLAQGEDGKLIHGIFASLGAGAVLVEAGAARFDEIEVQRLLVLGSGKLRTEVIPAGAMKLSFEGLSSPDDDPDSLVNVLQNHMRMCEVQLAERRAGDGACVFVDGPLNFLSTVAAPLVGVVKRILTPYLDAGHFALVGALEAGQRTPLFAIRDGKYDRYSWYLRLAARRPMEHFLAGIVRMEVRAALGASRAVELADFSARRLPGFASNPFRDPRAPQNLVPVGALEEELRRRMGDAVTIRRAIEKRIFEGVTI